MNTDNDVVSCLRYPQCWQK